MCTTTSAKLVVHPKYNYLQPESHDSPINNAKNVGTVRNSPSPKAKKKNQSIV